MKNRSKYVSVGTDASGMLPLGNGQNGVLINASRNLVGIETVFASMRFFMSSSLAEPDPTVGAANRIAFDGASGVLVQSGSSNEISQNSIHDNSQLGINLAQGANENSPAPVLTSIQWLASALVITGTLTAAPSSTYSVEFFANPSNSASGTVYMGSTEVGTNADGVANFTYTGALPPGTDSYITATATDPDGNTSEFSAALS